ncbi:DUF4176 domain-containing protein [Neobacillus sp. LXY-4]|uniref:DUF4176 domain-containing protein n=1 Tax=Neobacillus sp. LXY-4 TaxID=3379826 RepID=UPI003EE14227
MRVKKLESFIDSSMDRYPHGSIVLLKEGKKKLVIYGRKQILLSGEEPKMYDYLGCFFPEGYINQDYSFVFNHEDIEEILFIGFINEEEKQFVEFLSK